MRFPVVLFDLNGTLVDTLSDLTAALNETLTHLDRPLLDEAQVRTWSGEGLRGLLRSALRATGPEPTDLEINEWLHDFRARYAAHLGQRARVYPGVVETLNALLQAGARMAIITNKPEAPSLSLLAQLHLEPVDPAASILVRLGGRLTAIPKGEIQARLDDGTLGAATPLVDLALYSLADLRAGRLEAPLADTWVGRKFGIAPAAVR